MQVEPIEVLRQRRSAKWRTHPEDVLPLFIAEMDVPIAPVIADALRAAVDASDTGYAPPGAPGLGEAVAGFAARHWGWQLDPARVFAVGDVGVGAVELLRVLTKPGDTVLISPPVYPPFFGWAPEAGVGVREVPLTDGYRLDLSGLETAFAAGAAVYVLCNPHNPVGRVHTPEELTALVTLAARYGVTIVSDEIHAPLVLPGSTHTPLLSLPGAADVAVSLISASKAFNITGLKCAAVVEGNRPLTANFPPDVRWRVGHLGVLATEAAFTHGDAWLAELHTFLVARRAQLGELLRAHLPGVTWHRPDATYLAWLDCRALDLGDDPAKTFLERGRVALEPGIPFGSQGAGFVRLNFATSPEILDDAVTRMAAALT